MAIDYSIKTEQKYLQKNEEKKKKEKERTKKRTTVSHKNIQLSKIKMSGNILVFLCGTRQVANLAIRQLHFNLTKCIIYT